MELSWSEANKLAPITTAVLLFQLISPDVEYAAIPGLPTEAECPEALGSD